MLIYFLRDVNMDELFEIFQTNPPPSKIPMIGRGRRAVKLKGYECSTCFFVCQKTKWLCIKFLFNCFRTFSYKMPVSCQILISGVALKLNLCFTQPRYIQRYHRICIAGVGLIHNVNFKFFCVHRLQEKT